MANEIYISVITGLSIQVKLYNGLTLVNTFSAAEIADGEYVASMPAATPYGTYLLVAYAVGGDNPKVASGEIYWGGVAEMEVELHEFEGLNPNSAMTVTPTSRNVNGVLTVISGDGVTSSTITRQP